MRAIVKLCSLCVGLLVVACSVSGDVPHGGEISIAGLRALCRDRSVLIVDDLYIRGRVVANDHMGELHKMVILEDASGAIAIEVESDDVDRLLPLWSTLTVRCTGLHIGRVGGGIYLGMSPTSEYVVDRIDEQQLFNYITVDLSAMEPAEPSARDIAQITQDDMFRFVAVEQVYFVEQEWGMGLCDVVDSKPQHTIRHLTDGSDTMRVITSANAIFANTEIPDTEVRCCGVVDTWEDEVALRIVSNLIQYRGD